MHAPLLLSIKFFDTRCFLKYRRVPVRNFWTLWDKKLLAQKMISSSYAYTFSIPDSFLKHRRFPLRCSSILWDINFSTESCDVPCFLSSKFFDARNFSKHRKDHVQIFSALSDKRFPTEISDIPFLCKRCFDTRIYLKHRRVPLRKFLVIWDKNFEKTSWYNPTSLINKNLRNQKLSETPKCFPTKNFGFVRQKIINRK